VIIKRLAFFLLYAIILYSLVVRVSWASGRGKTVFWAFSSEGGIMSSDRCKYPDWTRGQDEALLNVLGGEDVAKKLIAGELSFELAQPSHPLFDQSHGRRIPRDLVAKVRDANWSFHSDQPEMEGTPDYAKDIKRLHRRLGVDTGIRGKQFRDRTEELKTLIREKYPLAANILNGVCLPIILPKLEHDDLGEALELYVEVAGQAYRRAFLDRSFTNYRKGTLANQVSIAEGSRHEQLIESMRQGPVIGLHFPNALQGFSICADREQMDTLPQGFILSGMDTPIAMAMYPKTLARDYNTPGLDLAALQWQSAAYSLDFGADAAGLSFGSTALLADAYGSFSGGLLFLG